MCEADDGHRGEPDVVRPPKNCISRSDGPLLAAVAVVTDHGAGASVTFLRTGGAWHDSSVFVTAPVPSGC